MAYLPFWIDGLRIIVIGAFGLRPASGPSGTEMWLSSNGVLQDASVKKSARQVNAKFLSTPEMHCLKEVRLRGGATERARIRPRDGSSGSKAAFDGNSELMP